MFCKFCGKEIDEGSKFCPYCGKEIEQVKVEVVDNNKANEDDVLLKVANVLIIISMVLTFWLIFPLVLGIFALQANKKRVKDSSYLVWSIVTLILINSISGILMLVYYCKD